MKPHKIALRRFQDLSGICQQIFARLKTIKLTVLPPRGYNVSAYRLADQKKFSMGFPMKFGGTV
jgi:hypothetical protein